MMNLRKQLYGVLAVSLMAIPSGAFAAKKLEIDDTKWISIGGGLRTSFTSMEDAAPSGDSRNNDFNLDSARLYFNGQITETIKFELNTECVFCGNSELEELVILDAIAKFDINPAFNIWAGRLLVPSDRAEMSGPYYASTYDFNKTPFYPSDYSVEFGDGGAGVYGRDQGLTIWGGLGEEKKFTYAVGAFNGKQGGSNQDDKLLYGTRLSYNFLDVESNPGYYTSSTYYGKGGDILTLAVAAQHQQDGAGTEEEPADFTGYSVDFLFEKVLSGNGVFTVEGEYKKFDTDLSEDALEDGSCFCMFSGDASTATALYMFGSETGPGYFQPYVRYTENNPDYSETRDEVEAGLNYIISGHNARVSAFYQYGDIATKGLNYTPSAGGDKISAFKIGLQLQF
ncbi:MAG: hypothetical protein V7744_10260 [Pseudomonadales bacterium]